MKIEEIGKAIKLLKCLDGKYAMACEELEALKKIKEERRHVSVQVDFLPPTAGHDILEIDDETRNEILDILHDRAIAKINDIQREVEGITICGIEVKEVGNE